MSCDLCMFSCPYVLLLCVCRLLHVCSHMFLLPVCVSFLHMLSDHPFIPPSVLVRVCVSSLCRWYYGNINRVKAEKLLLASQNKDGSFLVRISESHSDEYTISGKHPSPVHPSTVTSDPLPSCFLPHFFLSFHSSQRLSVLPYFRGKPTVDSHGGSYHFFFVCI